MVAKFDANTLGEEAEQSSMFIYGYHLDKARVLRIDYCLTKPGENSFHFFCSSIWATAIYIYGTLE